MLHPDIAWRAHFELGPVERVEVFSAPDLAEAHRVSGVLGSLAGVRADVAPLTRQW